jgi:hypothetical protein
MKPDYCPTCGNDRNNEHERDGSQLCWCIEDDEKTNPIKRLRILRGMRSFVRNFLGR